MHTPAVIYGEFVASQYSFYLLDALLINDCQSFNQRPLIYCHFCFYLFISYLVTSSGEDNDDLERGLVTSGAALHDNDREGGGGGKESAESSPDSTPEKLKETSGSLHALYFCLLFCFVLLCCVLFIFELQYIIHDIVLL